MKTKFKLAILTLNLMLAELCYSQVTHFGNNQAAGDLVGYDGVLGTPGPLEIRNDFVGCGTCNIDFYIDNNHFLQVLTGGNLNVVQPTNGYMIDNQIVLRHKGDPSSIFVGVAAGGVNLGNGNTFVGASAGKRDYSGNNNIAIGHLPMSYTGFLTQNTGNENIFIGSLSGFKNETGGYNVAIGYNTMLSNENGFGNSVLGQSAGFSIVDGDYNTFIGTACGNNCDGDYNTFMGYSAGNTSADNHNAFFGSWSGSIHGLGQLNSFLVIIQENLLRMPKTIRYSDRIQV